MTMNFLLVKKKKNNIPPVSTNLYRRFCSILNECLKTFFADQIYEVFRVDVDVWMEIDSSSGT